MRFLPLLFLLIGCTKDVDYKCVNGYVITDYENSESAICSSYYHGNLGVRGYNCYAVTGASPKGKYEVVFFKNYKIYYTKCYNLETR